MIRSSVVLPVPFGPIRATLAPSPTRRRHVAEQRPAVGQAVADGVDVDVSHEAPALTHRGPCVVTLDMDRVRVRARLDQVGPADGRWAPRGLGRRRHDERIGCAPRQRPRSARDDSAVVALVALVGALVRPSAAGRRGSTGLPASPAPPRAMWVWDTSPTRSRGRLRDHPRHRPAVCRRAAARHDVHRARRAAGARLAAPRRRACAWTRSAATPAGSTTQRGWSPTGSSPRSPPGCSPASTSTSSPTRPRPGPRTRQGRRQQYLATLDRLRTAAGSHADRGRHPVLVRRDRRRHRVDPGPRDHEAHRRGRRSWPTATPPTGPDGTLDVAAAELAAAASLGTPVRIGQETNYLGTDPTAVKQTFAGMTGQPDAVAAHRGRRGRRGLEHLRRDRHPGRGRVPRHGAVTTAASRPQRLGAGAGLRPRRRTRLAECPSRAVPDEGGWTARGRPRTVGPARTSMEGPRRVAPSSSACA